MKQKFRRIGLIWFVCLSILVLPVSTVWGFGKGVEGSDVFAVQGMLNSLGYFNNKITGYYGTITVAAVKQFQQDYGLPVNGGVDNQTLQAILWVYGKFKNTAAPIQTATPIQTAAPSKTTTPIQTAAPNPAPTTVPTSAPAKSANPGTGKSAISAEEQQMVDLVNQERAKVGLKALIVDPQLSYTARLKSQDMVNLNYFDHQSPTYGSPFDMMTQFGIQFQSAGENIACNQTVVNAHQALMNSPEHRANILNTSYNYIGIGIANGGPCGQMYTQQFVGR